MDNVYRHLLGLCEKLENSHPHLQDSNPHAIGTDESNKLLSGVKQLFKQSGNAEQIRLMTIAPTDWGRIMIRKWFDSSGHQAR